MMWLHCLLNSLQKTILICLVRCLLSISKWSQSPSLSFVYWRIRDHIDTHCLFSSDPYGIPTTLIRLPIECWHFSRDHDDLMVHCLLNSLQNTTLSSLNHCLEYPRSHIDIPYPLSTSKSLRCYIVIDCPLSVVQCCSLNNLQKTTLIKINR